MTPAALIRDAERRFRAARLRYGHGTDNAHDEAAFMVLRGLGLSFDSCLETPTTGEGRRRVESLIRKRIEKRIPAAYLLHEAWLDGHCFHVDRRVIVPRSHIAGLLSGRLRPWLSVRPRRILDLCTGSGCLAILAAKAFPGAHVDASDVSAAALAVARRNVTRHRMRGRVRLLRSDLMRGLGERRYDLILSNPPYVNAPAMRALPREYRREPRKALAGGADGLDLVRTILEQAPAHLQAHGLLVCEIGANRRALERAYARVPFAWPQTAAGSGQVFALAREALPRTQKMG